MAKDTITTALKAEQDCIAKIDAEMAALLRMREIHQAKIDAFQLALEAYPKPQGAGSPTVPKRRNRPPGETWTGVFAALHDAHPSEFNYEDLMQAAADLGITVQKSSLRTKMAKFVEKGHFSRVGDGSFAYTNEGRRYFKIAVSEPSVESAPPPAVAQSVEPPAPMAPSGPATVGFVTPNPPVFQQPQAAIAS